MTRAGRLWLVPLATAAVLACGGDDTTQLGATPTSAGDGVSPGEPQRTAVVVGGAEPISVEMADSPAERATGLMRRTGVPPGTGMLFVYETPSRPGFWMGNVEVPLSIAWVLDDTVVGVAEMLPCPAADSTCTIYYPDDPRAVFDSAVETTGRTFTDAGVRPGDPVTIAPLR